MKNFTVSVILFTVAIASLSCGNILLKLGMDHPPAKRSATPGKISLTTPS